MDGEDIKRTLLLRLEGGGGGASFSGVLFWMFLHPKQEMTSMPEEPIDSAEK